MPCHMRSLARGEKKMKLITRRYINFKKNKRRDSVLINLSKQRRMGVYDFGGATSQGGPGGPLPYGPDNGSVFLYKVVFCDTL